MRMDAFRVVLFGHRDLSSYKKLERRLFPILHELIRTKPFLEIYIGRNGEFDIYAASIVKRAQKAFGTENSELTLVIPYTLKDLEYYEKYYDNVIVPECVQNTFPKSAITKRNRWMIEACDLLICYVENSTGGARNALKYAKKLGKRIINLAIDTDFDDE